MKTFFNILICSFIILGCSSSGSNSDDDVSTNNGSDNMSSGTTFQRSELLANWSDNIIIPAYQSLTEALDNLNTAFVLFSNDTSESNLVALRTAWIEAYFVWQRVSMFEIGPAENIDYRLNMNIFPADTAQINANVNIGNADLSLPSNRDAKGFPALDYLLNGLADTDASIVARFTSATDGGNLLNYTERLILDMQSLTNQVLTQWTGVFRDQFVANDGSSSTASVDRYINDYIFYYERFFRAGKVGIPAGVFSGSTRPQNLEALHIGTLSNDLFFEALDAIQDFFNGVAFNTSSNGIGLDDYLNSTNNNELTTLINSQYNTARNAFLGLNSFQVELENTVPTSLLEAYDEIQRVIPLIKVDMLSALNINVDFQDADGD